MKKAKIMLVAITVLAVVGGALAFKARTTLGGTSYCLKELAGGPGACTLFVNPSSIDPAGIESFYTTEILPSGADNATCTTLACAYDDSFINHP